MKYEKQRIKEILARTEGRLAPVIIPVPVNGAVAVALYAEAMRTGWQAETLINEALRVYLGDML